MPFKSQFRDKYASRSPERICGLNSVQLVKWDCTHHLRPSEGPSVGPPQIIFERRMWPFLKVKSHQMISQTIVQGVAMK